MASSVDTATPKQALTTAEYLFNQLQSQRSARQGDSNALSGLMTEEAKLRQEVANIRGAADVYDREYMDTVEAGLEGPGFWRRRGFRTTGDWALFFFFLSYGILFVVSFIYVLRFSSRRLIAAAAVLGIFAFFGIGMTAFLLRVL